MEKTLDFSSVPVRCLNISTRLQLSQYLNGEQVITTSSGLARDYRGLAEQMSLSYAVIRNISRSKDPFMSLCEMYQNRSDATFASLVAMIENIERFDIIDDMMPYLLSDARIYFSNCDKAKESLEVRNSYEVVCFDAYVCYADDDIEFVQRLAEYLESPQIGLRLFIRDRDMILGTWHYESFLQLIESQCRRVLIILTPQFLQCPECDFQTKFAAGLAIEQRNRKLIPIIYKKCVLPPMIRMLTKIDLTGGKNCIPEWMYKRLVNSIKHDFSITPAFNNSISRNYLALPQPTDSNQLNKTTETINDNSLLTLQSVVAIPTAPLLTNDSIILNESNNQSNDLDIIPSVSTDCSTNSKKLTHTKWFQSIKRKFKVLS